MKTSNGIIRNGVYEIGADQNGEDVHRALWESMEKSFRAFSRKKKIERILNSVGEK